MPDCQLHEDAIQFAPQSLMRFNNFSLVYSTFVLDSGHIIIKVKEGFVALVGHVLRVVNFVKMKKSPWTIAFTIE